MSGRLEDGGWMMEVRRWKGLEYKKTSGSRGREPRTKASGSRGREPRTKLRKLMINK